MKKGKGTTGICQMIMTKINEDCQNRHLSKLVKSENLSLRNINKAVANDSIYNLGENLQGKEKDNNRNEQTVKQTY